MRCNDYDCAEVIEIGKAEALIQGWKDSADLDATGNPPLDRLYQQRPIGTD